MQGCFYKLSVALSRHKQSRTFSALDRFRYLLNAENPGFFWRKVIFNVVTNDQEFLLLKTNNLQFYWPSSYPYSSLRWLYSEIFSNPLWNPFCYDFKNHPITASSVVLDVGAAEGFFTFKALQSGAKVIAIECNPLFCKALSETFKSHILTGQLTVINACIGEQNGSAICLIDNNSPFTTSVITNPSSNYRDCVNSSSQTIDMLTLDYLYKLYPTINFIKMDIEGAETQVFNSADLLLENNKDLQLSIAVYHGLENYDVVSAALRNSNADISIRSHGIYAFDGVLPRPAMLLASLK